VTCKVKARRNLAVPSGTVDLVPSASQQSQIEIGPDGKKRMVGPVISLSDPLPGGSETLAGGSAALPAPAPLEQSARFDVVVKGGALPSTPGRIDDFVWPPRPAAAAAPPVPVVEAPPAAASPAALATPIKTADPAGEVSNDKPAVLTPVSKAN